jgi:hypothetical protein
MKMNKPDDKRIVAIWDFLFPLYALKHSRRSITAGRIVFGLSVGIVLILLKGCIRV